MSCYNAAEFLDESIRSVIQQSFDDFEFVIIDDGSQDSTANIIDSYAKLDKRIRYISKHNTGLADSLNKGIIDARGQWILRIDADDVCLPQRIESQLRLANENENLVLIGSNCIEIDIDGMQLKRHKYPTAHGVLVKRLTDLKGFFPHSSAMYRRAAALEVGAYRLRLNGAEDWDLWLRLSRVGQIACCERDLILLRKHATSISNEAGGRKSLVLAVAASLCYVRNTVGLSDPSVAPDAEWFAFIEWVTEWLDINGYFNDTQVLQRLRAQWYARNDISRIRTMGIIACNILHDTTALRALKRRLLGPSIVCEIDASARKIPSFCQIHDAKQ
jgi:glycosyltransferase involved in cell wall biosynthesis